MTTCVECTIHFWEFSSLLPPAWSWYADLIIGISAWGHLLMMLSKNVYLQLNSRELTHVINHLHMFGSHYRGERACAVRKIEWKLPDVHIIYLTLLSNLSCLFRYVSKLSTRTTFPSLTTQASFATVCTKNWSCDTQITAPLKFLTLSASVATLSKSKLVLV